MTEDKMGTNPSLGLLGEDDRRKQERSKGKATLRAVKC